MAADEAARAEAPEARGSIARRIGHNIGIVVTGNAAAAGFGVITLALNARALGTSGLGVLALIMTIATLVDRIAAFQTWQPLVKLGADALAAGDKHRVGQLITVALLFDAVAAIAAAVAAVVIVLLAGQRLGIPPEYLGVAAIYMATLVTRIADAPAGIMRLFNRFGLLTTLRASEAAGQCLAAAILFAISAPLGAYVLSFAGVAVVANIALLASSLRVAARNGAHPAIRGLGSAWAETWRAFWAFSWIMSLSGTIGVLRDRAPVLIIGALLGPAAVGLYHVADRLSGILAMVTWSSHEALYPEGARLAAGQHHHALRWFVLRVSAIGSAIGLIAIIGALAIGETILASVAGPEFASGYWPFVILTGAYSIAMIGIGANVGVLVTVGPGKLLLAHLLALSLSAPFVVIAIPLFGVAGAAAGQVVFLSAWSGTLAVAFFVWQRQHQTRKA